MKTIASALLVATLATAGSAAFAQASSPYPASAQGIGPTLSSEFRGVTTYEGRHENDRGVSAVYPTTTPPEHPFLADVHPGLVTYADRHANDPAVQTSSIFPASVDDNGPMLASEFPRSVRNNDAYAGRAQVRSN